MLRAPARIALQGDLGAGKTSFARGFLAAAGWNGRVPSPTFNILHEYPTDPPIYHADLYRVSDDTELDELDLPGIICDGILLVEWADRFPDFHASCAVQVYISLDQEKSEHARTIHIHTED